jgi:hypothetical protein
MYENLISNITKVLRHAAAPLEPGPDTLSCRHDAMSVAVSLPAGLPLVNPTVNGGLNGTQYPKSGRQIRARFIQVAANDLGARVGHYDRRVISGSRGAGLRSEHVNISPADLGPQRPGVLLPA